MQSTYLCKTYSVVPLYIVAEERVFCYGFLPNILRVSFVLLKECFEMPQSVGAIGGRPNHALYFVGCDDDDNLIYLDPHTTQESIVVEEGCQMLSAEEDQSFHTQSPGRMPLAQIDPSLALVSN